MKHFLADVGADRKPPFKYTAPLAWSTWNGLFGGTSLGLLIEAMEHVSGMPLFSVSSQYVMPVKQGDEVTVEAEVVSAGKSASQVRGTLRSSSGGMISAAATVGPMAAHPPSTGVRAAAPGPDDSPPRHFMKPIPGSLQDTMDVRVAAVKPECVTLWIRYPGGKGRPLSSSLVAAFADHPPFGLNLLLGNDRYGISLDTVYRCVTPPEEFDAASWIQSDMRFDFIGEQFALSTAHMWSQSGVLLGIGSQALRIRQGMVSPSRK